jgi:hypothetical protein
LSFFWHFFIRISLEGNTRGEAESERVPRIIPAQKSRKFASIGHHHNHPINQKAGMSRIANPEQLARLEAPLVRLVKGELSVALVEVPFGGATIELETRALVVLSIAGTEADVTVCAVVVTK